jgi:hypothetical protein
VNMVCNVPRVPVKICKVLGVSRGVAEGGFHSGMTPSHWVGGSQHFEAMSWPHLRGSECPVCPSGT